MVKAAFVRLVRSFEGVDIRQVIDTAEKLRSEYHLEPDMIFTSPAASAKETARIMANEFAGAGKAKLPVTLEELDEFCCNDRFVQGSLRHVPDANQTVLVVSHQGTIGGNVFSLLPQKKLLELVSNYRLEPGEAVVMEFDTMHWEEISEEKLRQIHLVYN